MKSYLGSALFVSPFIEGYAEATASLNEMTRDEFSWDESSWKQPYRTIFELHKKKLREAYCLVYPDYSLDWKFKVDASQLGVGGMLIQERPMPDGSIQEEVISIVSKRFSSTAENWRIMEQEAFAIYYAVWRCQNLVRGKAFVVETDHKNLVWMENSLLPKIQRQVAFLSTFNFFIRHISGVSNASDGLSRLFAKLNEAQARVFEGDVIAGIEECHGGAAAHKSARRIDVQ
jgi:phospholipid-translocating ATPase